MQVTTDNTLVDTLLVSQRRSEDSKTLVLRHSKFAKHLCLVVQYALLSTPTVYMILQMDLVR